LKPGQVVVNHASTRAIKILNKEAKVLGTVAAKEIVYGTMTGTDAGIYRLSKTYAQIFADYGVKPLLIAKEAPKDNLPIEVISGYWKKGYRCAVSGTVPTMQEADWSWIDSIRYTKPGCETIGGTSGSPIVEADTRTVVGVNNTSNESGERCTLNNPCEIDAAGNVTVTQGTSYGQQTYIFTTCLNADRKIDLGVEGCKLPKPAVAPEAIEVGQN
jgi:V8-like Glu-specific endopeptidase